jgi:hypothetical protein
VSSRKLDFLEASEQGLIENFHPIRPYMRALKKLIDLNAITKET